MRILVASCLCVASLCCAQLMSAGANASKSNDASLKTMKVTAPVNYDMLVYNNGEAAQSKAVPKDTSNIDNELAIERRYKNKPGMASKVLKGVTYAGVAAFAVTTGTPVTCCSDSNADSVSVK